ncbi:MAG: prepilin peptidase [Thaumarchaeota archaeon]|nr:prepilin peptidase [Nitrososphaerota archaeon]
MSEAELLRPLVALAMLSVASYYDIKTREVSDLVWILFGGTGAMLYLFGQGDSFSLLCTGIGIATGIGLFLSRVFGQADSLALIALAVVLPQVGNLPLVVIVSILTPLLASAFSFCYNVACNLADMFHGRLYSGMNEGIHRKAAAFFVLHRRRGYERFVFSAQNGNSFVFRFRPQKGLEFARDFDGYVASALPMIPFMLASTVLILFL